MSNLKFSFLHSSAERGLEGEGNDTLSLCRRDEGYFLNTAEFSNVTSGRGAAFFCSEDFCSLF